VCTLKQHDGCSLLTTHYLLLLLLLVTVYGHHAVDRSPDLRLRFPHSSLYSPSINHKTINLTIRKEKPQGAGRSDAACVASRVSVDLDACSMSMSIYVDGFFSSLRSTFSQLSVLQSYSLHVRTTEYGLTTLRCTLYTHAMWSFTVGVGDRCGRR
jgi:hypothetical protein